MRLPSSALIVGGLGIVAVVAWVALRDRAPATPEVPAGSAGGSPGKAAISAPEGPTLGGGAIAAPGTPGAGEGSPGNAFAPVPAPPRTGPDPTAGERFAAQARDPGWASTAERDLQRRLHAAAVPFDRVECRHDLCELVLAGDDTAVSDGISRLDGRNGLAGLASAVILTAPERVQGRLVVRAYAMFDRPAP